MSEPATTVPAATILMLRDNPTDGLEVFTVIRHHQIDFASGALVFPGGRVDAGDAEVRDHCEGADDLDDEACAFMAGAIREAFEECGILLARSVGESGLVSGERVAALEHYRDSLHKGETSLLQFLKQESLTLAFDHLQHFAHWITPEMMPKRFDTHFYLAIAPDDHIAIHDGHESVDSIWISPKDAIEGGDNGKYTIIFPTRLNIEMLGESSSVENAMEMAKARTVIPVLPQLENREDGEYLCIPSEAGYKVTESRMDDIMKP
ncbi:MAG: NUDIX hydrolase [Gammaproteobacteria bacterium]|jgi:8-oxo-dGTP pyrophosphatase MutT (NUDIX family)|nr:NUDIX hydrolase [Gammaproteobacteria bacterium]|tara:strand:+ start:520 stop:1311 length:792 start_codon:yes stop_codon:yes gene_type:complete